MLNWRHLLLLPLFLLQSGCSENKLNPIVDPPPDGVPAISVDPASVDFGVIAAGESSAQVVTLSSIGDVKLVVTAMQISEGDWAFELTEPFSGDLESGASSDLVVTYNSQGTESSGELQILSNDPDRTNLYVPLLAHTEAIIDTGDSDSSPPLSQPVAVCNALPAEVEAIHEAATWVGDSSYDSDGTIVSYDWTLFSAPAGATATMPAGMANRRNFVPDVAGDYVGELIVTDNDGLVSEPCYATLTATAGEGLWVETFWTHSGDDMDLHLVSGTGALMSSQDCYYGNCTAGFLDWGVRGDPLDDPALDLDDIPGTGPENINIADPANGTYTVYVHDYPGSVYSGRNDVTVNVYVGGILAWTDTRNINSEGCYEPFVEIDIPGGTATDLVGTCR